MIVGGGGAGRPLFSVVYPTRDRPAFIEQALKFLSESSFESFEVVIADNFSTPDKSCRDVVEASLLSNIKYVNPASQASMVENWNFALEHATGDYVLVLTDKMMVLPRSLERLAGVIPHSRADIYTWFADHFYPSEFPDYFGQGQLGRHFYLETFSPAFESYDPLEELRKKAKARTSRSLQPASHYNRGKVCFGAYSRHLIEELQNRHGAVFHDISPDYTSMILALSSGSSAVELRMAGIVHLGTDLSNGGRNAVHDENALQFRLTGKNPEASIRNLVIPGLYASQHATVGHDYLVLQKEFNLPYKLDLANWVFLCGQDLSLRERIWSSGEVRRAQHKLFLDFVRTMRLADKAKLSARVLFQALKVPVLSLRRVRLVRSVGRRARSLLFPPVNSRFDVVSGLFEVVDLERKRFEGH